MCNFEIGIGVGEIIKVISIKFGWCVLEGEVVLMNSCVFCIGKMIFLLLNDKDILLIFLDFMENICFLNGC